MPFPLHAHEAETELGDGVADEVVGGRVTDVDVQQVPLAVHGDARSVQVLLQDLDVAEDLDADHRRLRGDGGRGRVPQQPSAVDHHDPVADPLELAEQVRGDDHRDAEVRTDPADELEHVVAPGGVEPVGRLVEQDERRVVDQGLGELDPLPHPGGVAAHRPVPLLVQTDVPERVGGPFARGRGGQARHPPHVHDELGGGHVRRQAVVLGHVADALADGRPVRGDVVAEDGGRARGRGEQAQQDLQERGLARAVGTDEPRDPGLHLDGQVLDGGHRAEALGETLRPDQRHLPASTLRASTLHAGTVGARRRAVGDLVDDLRILHRICTPSALRREGGGRPPEGAAAGSRRTWAGTVFPSACPDLAGARHAGRSTMSAHETSYDEHLTRKDGSAVSPGHLEDIRRVARRDSASVMSDPDGPLLVGLRDETQAERIRHEQP